MDFPLRWSDVDIFKCHCWCNIQKCKFNPNFIITNLSILYIKLVVKKIFTEHCRRQTSFRVSKTVYLLYHVYCTSMCLYLWSELCNRRITGSSSWRNKTIETSSRIYMATHKFSHRLTIHNGNKNNRTNYFLCTKDGHHLLKEKSDLSVPQLGLYTALFEGNAWGL